MVFCVLIFLISACNYPGDSTPTATPKPQSYIYLDAPLDGSSIPMESYKLVFHGMVVPPYEYEVSINGIVVGTAEPVPKSEPNQSGFFSYGEYLWTSLVPGLYTIKVGITGDWEDTPAQAQVMIPFPNEVEENQPNHLIATKTSTPEPQACTLIALVNLFCRPGPGYDPVDEFTPEQSASVVAQSKFLWQVIGVNFGERCTVPKAENLVRVEQNEFCENLPLFIPPATPVPTVSSRQQPQCNDGVDNDNDGYADLRDPQCTSAGDNDELVL